MGSIKEDESDPTEVQEIVEVVTTAKIIFEVVTAVSDPITAASTNITAAKAQVPTAITNAAPSRVIAAPSRRRKGVTKAQARKNMMIYLKNSAGFKMDYFKGMTCDDIRPIFEKNFDSNVVFVQKTKKHIDEEESRALKRLNETQAEKVAKRQKLDEEDKYIAEILKKFGLTDGKSASTLIDTEKPLLKDLDGEDENDVTRLQALVDKKKVVVMKALIRDVLRLDDAEGVDFLPSEEIFAELARIGYERPSTKLTFYKAFFSS
nr:hypothetical protein [Tanacetum cinerariifolium]